MRTVTLVLPLPPNLSNGSLSRAHWSSKRRALDAWRVLALAQEQQLRGRRPTPMQRAVASAVLYVGRNPRHVLDDDNAVSRCKYALDLAKDRGWLVDDARPYCTLAGIPEQRTEAPRRLELTLTEVAS